MNEIDTNCSYYKDIIKDEIIINGVNVAGCEYMLNNKIKGKQHSPAKAMPYAKETSCICRKNIDTPYNFCKHNSNCHYKQLKRLEKENEELKEKIIKYTEENGNLIIQRNTVENKLRDTENRLISLGKVNTHNLVLLQRSNTALGEIREIVHNSPIVKTVGNAPMVYYSDYANKRNEIITKIDEVLR